MTEKVRLFDIDFDAITKEEAVERLLAWCASSQVDARYVVTPNVDHVVKLRSNHAFRAAYREAAMIVVDGKPVRMASKLLCRPLPETIPGSELCPLVLERSRSIGGVSVFLLGAAEGVAERAASVIQSKWPWVKVVGFHSPPMGFAYGTEGSDAAIALVNAVQPDVLVLGLGAPKQELWVHAAQAQLRVKTALCVGATIDFIAGEKARAPKWMQRAGLEWLHRVMSEPRRLASRYAHDAIVFPLLFIKEVFNRR